MKDSLIVLGATGTLGTYLVAELSKINRYKIYACGRRNLDDNYYERIGVNSCKVDITSKEDFNKLPQKNIKAVIQIAGVMPARMKGYNPQLYIDINTIGTLNVLEYCKRVNAEKYIFTQSHSDVAGHWNTGKLISPNASRKINYKGDHAVYIISKNAAVDLSEHYYQNYGVINVLLRLPTIYSYRPIDSMYVNGEMSMIAYRYMIQKAIKGETLEVWGDPNISKDIVYVKDFTQMVIKSVESVHAKGFYNVATGIGTTLDEQVKGIARVFSPESNPSNIIYRPEKPSQTSYLYDVENAKRDLDYEPKFNYLQMLEDMKLEMNSDRFSHLRNTDPAYI